MAFSFTTADIETIRQTLQAELRDDGSSWQFRVGTQLSGAPLVLNVHNNVALDDQTTGSLVTAQTQHGYFELHDCSGFVSIEPDEIIFVGGSGEFLSSLVIGSQRTCSLFANIRRSIINADFAKLDATMLMAAMQLSLAEQIMAS